ncbi:MAG: peptidoglycan recognition family protein [Planctomycetota bacterium]
MFSDLNCPQNPSRATRRWAPVAGVLLLAACGCGDKPESQTSSPVLRTTAAAEQRAPAPAAAPAASQLSVRTPLSQAELESIYRGAPSGGAVRSGTPLQAPAPAAHLPEFGVVAEQRWDVQITREWRHIVVHHSATPNGSVAAFDKAHKERGWDGVGYHFVIGNGSGAGDGDAEPTYRWRQQLRGAHAGNSEYNEHGIGICLVGDFEHNGPPTPRQMASLRTLVRFLQIKTGIPTYEVIGHGDVPPRHTECPGRWLDVAALRASLGGNPMPVPIHYTQSPATLSRSTQMARSNSQSGAALP